MKLRTVYVRFFRSFNFDYLRQEKEQGESFPWDSIPDEPDALYPFVSVDLEDEVTTVVGANESGKSQLISAIQCLLGDRPIEPRDFCRYSSYFGVRGNMPVPQFGGKFDHLSSTESEDITRLFGGAGAVKEFWFFRLGTRNVLYSRRENGFEERLLQSDELEQLNLPVSKLIRSDVALPASVSLYDLRDDLESPNLRNRAQWFAIHNSIKENEEGIASGAVPASQFFPVLSSRDSKEEAAAKESLRLVRDLILKVARVDPRAFSELLDGGDSDDGYNSAITASMSQAIADSLNFPKWWSQDKDFALEIHKDGFYLVLTMRDRTGQRYTFDERSGGMKFFLSYFIQYQSYAPRTSNRSEIVLMDEPDAFLSTQGQQDLLRVLKSYAEPDGPVPAAQVMYVTHSPFLIDRNRPERIRVLEKGYGEEGTRVVAKVAVDKYEPLRSAFGSFHADTAFIGSCNLLVEGPADLVLFSGISAAMRVHQHSGHNLDLNSLTMVPVHGATQYKYTLHLTRARDLDRPAVIVLMDSDPEGKKARDGLENGYGEKPILDSALIIEIDTLPKSELAIATTTVEEPEDLVPAGAALAALKHFANDVLLPEQAERILSALPKKMTVPEAGRLFDQVEAASIQASETLSRPLAIGKIEFARSLAAVVGDLSEGDRSALFSNFSSLFGQINDRQSDAMREQNQERLQQATRRLVERFRRDHKTRVTKAAFERFLQEVEHHLVGASPEEETVRQTVRELRDRLQLKVDPLQDVPNFIEVRRKLSGLVYSPLQGTNV